MLSSGQALTFLLFIRSLFTLIGLHSLDWPIWFMNLTKLKSEMFSLERLYPSSSGSLQVLKNIRSEKKIRSKRIVGQKRFGSKKIWG